MVRKLEDYLHDEATRDSDDRSLVSRTEERREKQRVETIRFELAAKLSQLKPGQLARLALPEPCLDIIDEIRVIVSAPARTRALKRLRAELRDIDLTALTRAIAALSEPRPPEPPSEAARWLEQLQSRGDAALDEFATRYPGCDRARLRTLLRNSSSKKPPERARADNRLLAAIREVVGQAVPAPAAATVD